MDSIILHSHLLFGKPLSGMKSASMHSNRMCTARCGGRRGVSLLTGGLCAGGISALGGGGGLCPWRDLSWRGITETYTTALPLGQNDTRKENNTLAKSSFKGGYE